MQAYKTILTYLAADKLKYESDLQNAINQIPLNDILVRDILEKITLNELMVQKWLMLAPEGLISDNEDNK